MPSLRIGSSPERTVLRATRVAVRAAAMWKKDLHPSAQRMHTQAARKIIVAGCQQRPFWAVSAMGAAWIGSNECHGHEYATIGDFASLGQQLSAVSMHRACTLYPPHSLWPEKSDGRDRCLAELRARMRRLGATCTAVKPQSICMIDLLLLNTHISGRIRAESSHFRHSGTARTA